MKSHKTPQDKLALALTSAGSERALASALGVSPRTIGRWLREGQEDGVKQIPAYAEKAINTVFNIHKEITKTQAKSDGIPFFPDVPVFAYRPQTKATDPRGNRIRGDRMISPRTEHIDPELRKLYLAYAHQSGKFWGVSIRSVIDWYQYVTDQKKTSTDNYQAMRDGTVLHKPSGEIIEQVIWPVYTESEDIRKGVPLSRVLRNVEAKLKGKHERSAVRFADEYLLQMMPSDYRPDEKQFDRRYTPAKKVFGASKARSARKAPKNKRGK